MNDTLNLIKKTCCNGPENLSNFERLNDRGTEITLDDNDNDPQPKTDEEMLIGNENRIVFDQTSHVTCRGKIRSGRRKRRKKKCQTEISSSPSFFELVSMRNEKLKPILRAAKRLSRCARRSTAKSKQIRFLPTPKYIDITPRPEKVEGIIKMPLSPPKSTDDEEPLFVVPNEEEAIFFENLPFTEEETTTQSLKPTVRKRRSSTRLRHVNVINSDSGDQEICILHVTDDQQQASTSSRSSRRRSFIVAAERLNVQSNKKTSKKTPKRDDSKRKLNAAESEKFQIGVRHEEIFIEEKSFFPIFNKKSKSSPKKCVKKLDLKKIPIEKPKKGIELIEIHDCPEIEIRPVQSVVVDSWEMVKKQMCNEKDFAPFSSLNYFDCGESFDSIPDETENHFIPLANDDETKIFPFSYAGSSYSDLFKLCQREHQTGIDTDTIMEEGISDDGELCNVPWVERFRPKTSSNFLGDSQVVSRLKEWLNKWKIRLRSRAPSTQFNVRSPKKSRKRKKSDSNDYFDDEDYECNTVIIVGPTGVGKTCLVYCLAEELGFNVIEINASSRRSYKDVVANHIGATHSHRIDLQAPKFVAVESLPQKAKSKKDLRSFFVKSSPIRKRPEHQPEEICVANAASIILIDDVDVIFEEDENFWNGVRDLTKDCQVPVILTSTEKIVPGLQTLNVEVEQFELNKATKTAFIECLSCLPMKEWIADVDEKLAKLSLSFDGDLRKCTNHLQFWSNFDKFYDSNESPDDVVEFRNLARIMDGLNDNTSANDDIAPRRYSYADENILSVRQLNCVRNCLQPRQALYESDLVTDYLPYLRKIASISVQRSVERRRFRHYLYNIGLDDKWGSNQTILQQDPFLKI